MNGRPEETSRRTFKSILLPASEQDRIRSRGNHQTKCTNQNVKANGECNGVIDGGGRVFDKANGPTSPGYPLASIPLTGLNDSSRDDNGLQRSRVPSDGRYSTKRWHQVTGQQDRSQQGHKMAAGATITEMLQLEVIPEHLSTDNKNQDAEKPQKKPRTHQHCHRHQHNPRHHHDSNQHHCRRCQRRHQHHHQYRSHKQSSQHTARSKQQIAENHRHDRRDNHDKQQRENKVGLELNYNLCFPQSS
ncbi:unnamed protein product [Protopolystoma xenopodis]|uniref:Uncharacterized protein n=1 Tax=Protopolystoma xenopodis TaxID=117903 RepID=A0A3S5CS50_9PLAT|nr:unnamed protein product [Protopolystoma xenopodis]